MGEQATMYEGCPAEEMLDNLKNDLREAWEEHYTDSSMPCSQQVHNAIVFVDELIALGMAAKNELKDCAKVVEAQDRV